MASLRAAAVPLRVRRSALAFIAAIIIPTSVSAQDVPRLVATPVYVHSGSEEIRGQLLKLGPDSLTILENGRERDLRLAEITRIEAPGDSVRNGAIIGAIVLGAWCALICPQGLDGYHDNEFAYVLGVNIALGAAVGAGIDGMHVGRTTIFQADGPIAVSRAKGRKVSLALGIKF